MSEEEKEEIYETTVQVLHLGYNLEDAKERLGDMVLVNDTYEETKLSGWTHLDDPTLTIKDLTYRIKRLERRGRY